MRTILPLAPMLLSAACAASPALDAGGTPDADPPPDADSTRDGGVRPDAPHPDGAALDAAPPPEPWEAAHCAARECYFIMQNEPGADDRACNGRSATDLGTYDAEGRRNCPFKSFLQTRVRALLNPDQGPNKSRSFFVGEGRYATWPWALILRGDGAGPEEAVRLANYRGQHAELHGDECPAACTVTTETGTVTLAPCCAIRCGRCDADPRCVPLGDGCGIPWDKASSVVNVLGSWARVEGLEISGCFSDALVVSARAGETLHSLVPNEHLYVAQNKIGGCDVNENIKAYGQGPGPLQGGPVWGPTHVVGNELFDMASQGVDATGVHAWRVEDNYLHSAKRGAFMGTSFDGGGIGFKNGGSQAQIRHNWLAQGGGVSLGGASGSCERDTEPPAGYGCFQTYELTQGVAENNVILDSDIQALQVYQCDGCSLRGNVVDRVGGEVAFRLSDECPGSACPPHNPRLLPSRDLALAYNHLSAGPWHREGPYLMVHPADVFPAGPAASGMNARHNELCAASGVPAAADPAAELLYFGHVRPPLLLSFSGYAPLIGDQGSRVANAAGASVAPCASLPACVVSREDGELSWSAAGARCLLAVDGAEVEVPCVGRRPLAQGELSAGRHHAALFVERTAGGGACGATYQVAAPVVGEACALGLAQETARLRGGGGRCRLSLDGGSPVFDGACTAEVPLPAAARAAGRHRLLLSVLDSEAGQTACSLMFNRGP